MKDSPIYEKLDLFYLGREMDPAGQTTSVPLLYKHSHLTTHAAIIGMTGSGKTGLGICLLEEAAIDRLPAIVIDPKGDMGNLLLTFPEMRPEDFLPWVDQARAEQKGVSREELARATAAAWEQGLAGWDQKRDRIARLKANADFALFTPGSGAGRPVSDYMDVNQDDDFQSWVKGRRVRQALYQSAMGYDVEAADELLSTYKQLRTVKQKAVNDVEVKARDNALKAASVDTSGTGETTKKIYRRADLIRLRIHEPTKYEGMQEEISRAYAEGRVR